MKFCFIFSEPESAKKVLQFLSTYFQVTLDNCLDYITLSVPKRDYRQAVDKGLVFINCNNISGAWWFNVDNKRMDTDVLPLLHAQIPDFFRKNKFLAKIADILCNKYAKNFANRLNTDISLEYTSCDGVNFNLVRSTDVVENHEIYTEEIIKYTLGHWHIFSHIIVLDAYGNSITMINRNHSTQWPIPKTPH